MITESGIYIQRDPLRIVAAGIDPDGGLALLEFPLTPDQAASFSVHLARAAAAEVQRIDEFDAEFLRSAKVAVKA